MVDGKVWVRFPSTVQEKAVVMERFIDRGKIVEVVGCVDRTLHRNRLHRKLSPGETESY